MRNISTAISAGAISVAAVVLIANPAFAWHPVGTISKQVQNVTQKSALVEANTAAEAIAAKPGDTLKYVITVKNSGKYDSRGWNDMHYTKVTDVLPAGVQLSAGQANADLGHVAAGKTKSYEFTVKVTSTQDNAVICNTAKFTGDSEVRDQPQKGEDTACVKVTVPPKPVEPTKPTPEVPVTPEAPTTPVEETPVTTEAPVEEVMPAELPQTGAAGAVAQALGLGAVVTASVAFIRNRR